MTRDQSGFAAASPWRDRRRRDRRRLDDWCWCLRSVGARDSRRRRLVVGRTRNRRCRRLLQRNLLGAVGGDLSRVRRHLCLRSTAALTLLGACRRMGFRVGKTASCSAMALTLGAYLWPEQQRLTAALAVMVITGVNIGGLQRTVAVTRCSSSCRLWRSVVWCGSGPPALRPVP